ncbi:hypothetical protein PF008_g2042 [Phytophthora fragariae]|uniref:Uncharacterized protein n=1 Tax=Phytophthora fragariae TaxID=53985 RepID=A0A6G0SIA5_9STRA|nr:hypothetical protein PF008_g2042 [Phytophthora fragariae]
MLMPLSVDASRCCAELDSISDGVAAAISTASTLAGMFGVASALLMIPSPMMPSAPAYSSTTVASLSSPDDSGSASIAAGKLRCGMVDKGRKRCGKSMS